MDRSSKAQHRPAELDQVDDVWYYVDHTGQVGPFTLQELKIKLSTIQNAKSLHVWCDGMADWQPVASIPELNRQVNPPPPPRINPPNYFGLKYRQTIRGVIGLVSILAIGVYFSGSYTPASNSAPAAAYVKKPNEVESLRRAANDGSAEAQNDLGIMYENGSGVPQNYATAVTWYRKAADQGFATAQYNLGTMYEYGEGVPKDDAEAVRWYRKAAAQGDADAKEQLALRGQEPKPAAYAGGREAAHHSGGKGSRRLRRRGQ
jgi:hypothetical protein